MQQNFVVNSLAKTKFLIFFLFQFFLEKVSEFYNIFQYFFILTLKYHFQPIISYNSPHYFFCIIEYQFASFKCDTQFLNDNNLIEIMYFWNYMPDTWLSNNQIPYYTAQQPFSPPTFQFIQEIHSPNLLSSEAQNLARSIQIDQNSVHKTIRQSKRPQKLQKEHSDDNGKIKVSRNIKSLIIKDFIKFLKKDASKILPIKSLLNSQYPIKEFLEKLNKNIPIDKEKYIKVKSLQELCFDQEDKEFSCILRILLKNFLCTEYEVMVLNKKKNKAEYMKGSRQLYSRIFYGKNLVNQH